MAERLSSRLSLAEPFTTRRRDVNDIPQSAGRCTSEWNSLCVNALPIHVSSVDVGIYLEAFAISSQKIAAVPAKL